MALALTPTSELEAVNIILGVVGENPVNSLDVAGLANVDIARQVLHDISREVQSQDWNFNTEYDYPLPLTLDGYLLVPPNTLKLDLVDDLIGRADPVQRGDRMYDRKTRSWVFTEPLRFDMTFFLPFEQIPEQVRRYIAIRAARFFQRRFLSSTDINAFTEEEEMAARAGALAADASTADYNMAENYDVFQIMDR